MSGVSSLTISFIAWGIVTGMFVVLMIYRSLISMKEDDQLFLDPAEASMEAEQKQLLMRLNKITPYTRGLGFASLGLLLVIAGIWVSQAISGFNAMP